MKQEAMNEEELDKKFRKTLMMLYSSDFERTKEEGRREGLIQGNYEGIEETEERVAVDMLKYGEPIEKIIKYSRLDEEDIREIAQSLGLSVV